MKHPLPPLPLVDGALFIDNSTLELLTTCPRALEYNRLWRRVLAGDKPSLNFGSAIHEALEYRYAVVGNRLPTPLDEDAIAAVLADFFANSPTPEGDFRTLNWAVEVMRRYNQKYQIEPFQLLSYDKPVPCPKCANHLGNCRFCGNTMERNLMVEMPFALPLFTWQGWLPETLEAAVMRQQPIEIPVIYTGRIDLPVLRDDAIWVIDHKTTSLLGQPFFERMRMSAQQRGYVWAFQTLTGRNVAGYEVNALRVKEPPLSLSNGKESAIAKWWDESSARERYYITAEAIEEWKTNAISLVEEFFWHYQQGYMPMKTAWCTQFGRCPYFDVCNLPPGDRGVMLSSGLFTENRWSPLNKVTSKKV